MKLEKVEDREDENEKQQQKGEESRKRKMGADEARVEQMKERARNFISKKAATLMEGSLKDRSASLPKESSKRLSLLLLKCWKREDGSHKVNTKNLFLPLW